MHKWILCKKRYFEQRRIHPLNDSGQPKSLDSIQQSFCDQLWFSAMILHLLGIFVHVIWWVTATGWLTILSLSSLLISAARLPLVGLPFPSTTSNRLQDIPHFITADQERHVGIQSRQILGNHWFSVCSVLSEIKQNFCLKIRMLCSIWIHSSFRNWTCLGPFFFLHFIIRYSHLWSWLTFTWCAVGVPTKEHRGNLSLHLVQLHTPIHLQLLRPV